MKLTMSTFAGTIGLSLMTALMAAATPATAVETDIVRVDVRYGDLNLTSEAGAKAMYARMYRAATQACGGTIDGVAGLGQTGRMRKCRKVALGTAIADLRSPLVSALYNDKSQRNVQLASR